MAAPQVLPNHVRMLRRVRAGDEERRGHTEIVEQLQVARRLVVRAVVERECDSLAVCRTLAQHARDPVVDRVPYNGSNTRYHPYWVADPTDGHKNRLPRKAVQDGGSNGILTTSSRGRRRAARSS